MPTGRVAFGLSWYEYQTSGSVTGGSSWRPGSTDGPPSRTQRDVFFCVGPPQSICLAPVSGDPAGAWCCRSVNSLNSHSQYPSLLE